MFFWWLSGWFLCCLFGVGDVMLVCCFGCWCVVCDQVLLYGWLCGDFGELVFDVWEVGYVEIEFGCCVQLWECGDIGD